MSLELKIPGNLLPHLGVLMPGERSPVSPILPTGDHEQQAAARQSLRQAGIVDDNGAIMPAYSSILSMLALSGRKASCSLYFPGRHITVDRYFVQNNSTITLLDQDGLETRIGKDVPVNDIIAATGLSDNEISTRYPHAEISLPPADFLHLAALMDYERATTTDALLKSIKDNTPLPHVIHTEQSARQTISSFVTSMGDYPFLSAASDLADPGVMAQAGQAAISWNTLAAKEIVTPASGGYHLSDSLQALIRRLILTDMTMEITVARSNGDNLEYTDRAYCFRADGFLTWIKLQAGQPGIISLRVTPAGILRQMMDSLLRDPAFTLAQFEAAKATVPSGPAPQPQGIRKFCPQCGNPLKPGLKFCSSCGAKIT
jgi:hypothetical protein